MFLSLKLLKNNTYRDQNVTQVLIPKSFINIWGKKYSLLDNAKKNADAAGYLGDLGRTAPVKIP